MRDKRSPNYSTMIAAKQIDQDNAEMFSEINLTSPFPEQILQPQNYIETK